MDNIIDVELTGRSTRRDQKLWQYDYGQVLRIAGKEFPKVTEVQFSLQQSGGHTLDRIGTFDNGVLAVQIPNELLQNKGETSDYTIYAFVYLSGDESGNTKYMIQLPVESRPEPTDPSEDPTIDPSIFKDAVNAVNASAERAETAEKSAKESADKAKEYAESAGKSKKDVENARDDAISAIGTEKESALRGIASKTDESVQKIQSQTEESQNSIKQSIADATEKKTELEGAISNATDAKGNLDKAVQSAGNAKSELDASVGKAGETKTELDSSISSAEEKKLALDATIEQANTVDASLKEQIGSAEQIQANVEQIAKNKTDISSINEDLAEVQDKKITKFYASNQGETHLVDSDSGKIVDMSIYGKSEQFTTTGKNLLPFPYTEKSKTENGVTFDVKDDGKIHIYGTATETTCFNLSNNIEWGNESFSVKNERYILIGGLYYNAYNKILSCAVQKGETLDKILAPMVISINETNSTYEPYTGGIPSPNPDYPQEIKSVVNPVVKVCGKNLWDNFKTLSLGNVEQKNGTYIATADTMQVDITNDSIGARPLLLKANNAYTFSLKTTVSVSSPKFVCLRYTNGENNNIIFTNKNFVNFVPERDVEKIGFILYESVAGDKAYDVQLEMGSEVTSYEPYHEQSVQLPYTLNAIPVDSGGNITIDGQQYIADRVVEKDGVFGIERNIATDVPVLTEKLRETADTKGRFIQDNAFKKTFTPLYAPLVNIGYGKVWGVAGSVIDKWIFGVNKANFYITPPKNLNYTSDDAFNALKDLNIKVYGVLSVSIFEPLPEDIQSKLRALSTNYPVTNIEVSSDQLDGYTVFNYPISMAEGWNYVKQQLNDNRDYIYDMDTKTQDIDIQSAEAYVNSEYAVALTELEV